jgi:hypothetical protein
MLILLCCNCYDRLTENDPRPGRTIATRAGSGKATDKLNVNTLLYSNQINSIQPQALSETSSLSNSTRTTWSVVLVLPMFFCSPSSIWRHFYDVVNATTIGLASRLLIYASYEYIRVTYSYPYSFYSSTYLDSQETIGKLSNIFDTVGQGIISLFSRIFRSSYTT